MSTATTTASSWGGLSARIVEKADASSEVASDKEERNERREDETEPQMHASAFLLSSTR